MCTFEELQVNKDLCQFTVKVALKAQSVFMCTSDYITISQNSDLFWKIHNKAKDARRSLIKI